MTTAGLIELEVALLPEEIRVLQLLAKAGGEVFAAIKARQQGAPITTPIVQTGEAAWHAIVAMSDAHTNGKPST